MLDLPKNKKQKQNKREKSSVAGNGVTCIWYEIDWFDDETPVPIMEDGLCLLGNGAITTIV